MNNENRLVTKSDLKDFYDGILPYLGGGGGGSTGGGIDPSVIAPEFDATESYARTDLVWYNNILYECTNAHIGVWDNSHFSNKDLSEIFQTRTLRTPLAVNGIVQTDLETVLRGINSTASEISTAYKTGDNETTTITDDANIPVAISGSIPAQRRIAWSNIKSNLKTYFDDLYTYTAGDGVDITNNEISTKVMQDGDMDDIISVLPSAQSKYHKYSADEQIVGEWIDGKPIYEKTITLTKPSTVGVHGFTDIGASVDTVVSLDAKIKIAGSWQMINCMGFADTAFNSTRDLNNYVGAKIYAGTHDNTSGLADKIALRISAQNWLDNGEFIATIQYTKTTD